MATRWTPNTLREPNTLVQTQAYAYLGNVVLAVQSNHGGGSSTVRWTVADDLGVVYALVDASGEVEQIEREADGASSPSNQGAMMPGLPGQIEVPETSAIGMEPPTCQGGSCIEVIARGPIYLDFHREYSPSESLFLEPDPMQAIGMLPSPWTYA